MIASRWCYLPYSSIPYISGELEGRPESSIRFILTFLATVLYQRVLLTCITQDKMFTQYIIQNIMFSRCQAWSVGSSISSLVFPLSTVNLSYSGLCIHWLSLPEWTSFGLRGAKYLRGWWYRSTITTNKIRHHLELSKVINGIRAIDSNKPPN